ncbi:MAG: DUF72 domain-containing protein [Acidimicrobiales bacterium]
MTGEVRVGTSGWSYPEWVGPFYPPGTSVARMLQAYAAGGLSTVEAHATYRRRPTASTLSKWLEAVGPEFRFAPKAHLGITHRRDLEGVEDRVAGFFDALAPLGERLGPVLFQLPHHQPDLVRLDRILGSIPAAAPGAAFELGPAWRLQEVTDRLAARGAALVWTDEDPPSASRSASPSASRSASPRGGSRPVVQPAPPPVGAIAYVRLRRDHYTGPELAEWAQRLATWAVEGREVYAFLKHDRAGSAPLVARRLAERAARAGRAVRARKETEE